VRVFRVVRTPRAIFRAVNRASRTGHHRSWAGTWRSASVCA